MKVDADVRSEAELSAFYAHQDDAVTAIMRIYTPSPRARRPRFRAQLHMAPGLGKTRVAARVADLVAGQGSLLTVVPTRTLLEQTHHVLRAAGRSGPVIAVYSPRGAALAGEPGGAGVDGSTGGGVARERLCRPGRPVHGVGDVRERGELADRRAPAEYGAGRGAAAAGVGPAGVRRVPPHRNLPGLGSRQRAAPRARPPPADEARLRELVAARGRADAGVRAELLTASLGAVLRAAGRVGCQAAAGLPLHRGRSPSGRGITAPARTGPARSGDVGAAAGVGGGLARRHPGPGAAAGPEGAGGGHGSSGAAGGLGRGLFRAAAE
ncbi:DEAD/DEAH box helicase family protein [Streptomyces flavofungini]|uniref:DEAD/DEAH box helicase family protein n=1 Tax=Streptomyces flavofungini TaxID=68200 RepID=UPI00339D3CD3